MTWHEAKAAERQRKVEPIKGVTSSTATPEHVWSHCNYKLLTQSLGYSWVNPLSPSLSSKFRTVLQATPLVTLCRRLICKQIQRSLRVLPNQ